MDSYKILGQINPGAASVDDLYEVPVPAVKTVGPGAATSVTPKIVFVQRQTLVTSIIVCDIGAAATTFNILLLPLTGTVVSNEHYIFKSSSITSKETKILSLGLTLGQGNTIKVSSASGDLTFTAMGIEVT